MGRSGMRGEVQLPFSQHIILISAITTLSGMLSKFLHILPEEKAILNWPNHSLPTLVNLRYTTEQTDELPSKILVRCWATTSFQRSFNALDSLKELEALFIPIIILYLIQYSLRWHHFHISLTIQWVCFPCPKASVIKFSLQCFTPLCIGFNYCNQTHYYLLSPVLVLNVWVCKMDPPPSRELKVKSCFTSPTTQFITIDFTRWCTSPQPERSAEPFWGSPF